MKPRIIIPEGSRVHALLTCSTRERRAVFIVGLPGVGKTLMVQQLALLAHAAGRPVHLLQWDIARQAFETPEILARYPEVEGTTHAAIRYAAGTWVRGAVANWAAEHGRDESLLIGEAPFVGGRFVELAGPDDDAAESFLSSEAAQFLLPTPTLEVRRAIERTRALELAGPRHALEAANAPPNLLELLMRDLRVAGIALGIGSASAGEGYDPRVYAAVYGRLLQRRHLCVLEIDEEFPVQGSPYELQVAQRQLRPDAVAVARALQAAQALGAESLQRAVTHWFERAASRHSSQP